MADPVVVTVVVPDLPVVTEVGVQGVQGPVGPGVAQGGDAHQLLAKVSGTDFDTEWVSDLENIASVYFDVDAGVEPNGEGLLFWDDEAGTLDVGLNNDVTLHVGQETFIRVKNQSGQSLPKGTLLAYDGTVGQSGRLLVKKAVADGSEPAKLILGVAASAIADGADGYALQQGRLRLNTNSTGWQDESILWADPAVPGGLTDVEPEAPNLRVAVAVLVAGGTNGRLYVRLTFGSSLRDDELVFLNGLSDGDVLQFDGDAGRFVNVQPPVGPEGPPGEPGAAATVDVGTTTTVGPNDPAAVTNSGTSSAAILDFDIPQGVKGDTGDAGEPGEAGPPGVVISDDAPDDTGVLWADTSEPGDAVVPAGGSAGQSLVKVSGDDYDTEWQDRVASDDVSNIVVLTQAEYDGLTPDPATLYIIVG